MLRGRPPGGAQGPTPFYIKYLAAFIPAQFILTQLAQLTRITPFYGAHNREKQRLCSGSPYNGGKNGGRFR